MRATIGDITGGQLVSSEIMGEGCEAVGGSSDMNGPWLGGSSFGQGVNLDGRGTNGGK